MTATGMSRELKRLIADIAAAPAEDRAAILDELQPELRARAAALLEELEQSSSLPAPALPEEKEETPPPTVWPPGPIEGLSPWLQQRLDQVGAGAIGLDGITPTAAAALQASADVLPQPRRAQGARTKEPSLLHKLLFPSWGRR